METAKRRVGDPRSEADLRRATSDLYYALFHRVCEALVAPIWSDRDSQAFKETITTIYRLPEHKFVESRCKEIEQQAFSGEVKTFARTLMAMKNKRADADYDPLKIFEISAVRNDVILVEKVLEGFNAADLVEQTRFAYFVALKGRKLD